MAQFELNRSDILLGQLVQAAGVLLFAAPLTFLLQAAAARSESVRRQMVGFTIAGPLLLAISLILYFAAYDSVASSVIDHMPSAARIPTHSRKDALTGQTTYSTFGALQIAGLITMVIAIIYTSLWAMRTGLLTRFLGFIGIALGVGFILIGPFAARHVDDPRQPADRPHLARPAPARLGRRRGDRVAIGPRTRPRPASAGRGEGRSEGVRRRGRRGRRGRPTTWRTAPKRRRPAPGVATTAASVSASSAADRGRRRSPCRSGRARGAGRSGARGEPAPAPQPLAACPIPAADRARG